MAPRGSSEKFGRKSERELYLDRMQEVMPWGELLALVMPHDPVATSDGLPILLRTYFAQQWFNLSDSAAEEALYESPVLRRFAGVDLNVAAAPDEFAIHDFRQLLEKNNLGSQMLVTVNRHLEAQGIRISTSSTADATIVAADVHHPPELPGADEKHAGAQETTGRRSQAKVAIKAGHLFLTSGTLSVAVISPDSRRRNAATDALAQCQSGPIREFTSYPPNLNDVPQMLTRDFDVVIVDLDTDPEYALNLVKSICAYGLSTVIV